MTCSNVEMKAGWGGRREESEEEGKLQALLFATRGMERSETAQKNQGSRKKKQGGSKKIGRQRRTFPW